jgi:hypothetical protein
LTAALGAPALLIGLVLCIFSSTRQLGKTTATCGAAALAFVITCAIFAPKPTINATATQTAKSKEVAQVPENKPQKPTQLSRTDILKNIRIAAFRWEKSGFGSVMMATFVIYNDNSFPVKDVEVTCIHKTKTDTTIDRNRKTVYEVISQRGYQSVVKLNMGIIHSAVDSSTCTATNFAKV